MQRSDKGAREAPLDQLENMAACDTPEDAELMLQARDVKPTPIYEFRCGPILSGLILVDRRLNHQWVGMFDAGIAYRENGCASDIRQSRDRLSKISGESCDAAAARQRIADECNAEGKTGQIASELAFRGSHQDIAFRTGLAVDALGRWQDS